jgi:hypothetical protein
LQAESVRPGGELNQGRISVDPGTRPILAFSFSGERSQLGENGPFIAAKTVLRSQSTSYSSGLSGYRQSQHFSILFAWPAWSEQKFTLSLKQSKNWIFFEWVQV